MLIFVEVDPLQTVWVPVMFAVGAGVTFTTALPVRSPAIDVQFASLKAVTV
jgi:hypothetical protein